MAKGSANPADAFRKTQRARELKKNKEERKKVRETQTVKRDTREIEGEIKRLKDGSNGKPLTATDKSRLTELESELAYVVKVKENFVKDHPEARDKVFKTHSDRPQQDGGRVQDLSHLYDKEGKLRDPSRSVYYDPVYNPFGVPPPGMQYKQRTPEVVSEDEEDGDEDEESDEDIVMPQGPPPDLDSDEDGESDGSDDIPLPQGPAPPKVSQHPPPFAPALFAPPFRPSPYPQFAHPMSTPLFYPSQPFPPPPDFANLPQRPAFRPAPPGHPPHAPRIPHPRPPAMQQDPLSDAPTQTYQGYRMQQHELPPRPSAPGLAVPSASGSTAVVAAASGPKSTATGVIPEGATITAAPQLRDLRKEATAFVPRGVKRKKIAPGGVSVNSAPGAALIDEDGDEVRAARDVGGGLMGKLQGVLGGMKRDEETRKVGTGDDDYQRFLDGLGDLT